MNNIPRIKEIYGNCKVYSPDGVLMFRCSDKRLKWYTSRNLAELIDSDSKSAKLKFAPSGLGNHNKNFGLFDLENICVCCGSKEFLTKHHIVPHCYRKHFPINIKSHNFHDVSPVCMDCHYKYEKIAFEFKKKLSIEYNAPFPNQNVDDVKIKKLISPLINNYPLPKKRISEIKSKLKDILGVKRITKSKIIKLSSLKSNPEGKSHGEILVSNLSNIDEFIYLWRNHFVTTMNCKFLPKNWSVNN